MKRLFYLLFLVGAVVMASCYGGNISYLLLYFALLLPLSALIYSLYVYVRFKIVQEMERTVVKAQRVPYSLILANEDIIPFTCISLNYFTERVTIKEFENTDEQTAQTTSSLGLLPGERIRVDTKLYCKYRGTYPAGVKSVSVTDFLGLFTITYPLKEQLRVTVKPRIIPFEQLSADLKKQDPKNSSFSVASKQELLDYELRSYQPGDSLKYIHWKNSAKAGELLVRKQMPEEMTEIVVIPDLFPIGGELEERLLAEDTVIETAVSFVHHYFMKKMSVRVVYMGKEGLTELLVNDRREFDAFYNLCADLPFVSVLPVAQVYSDYLGKSMKNASVIVITSSVSDELRQMLGESQRIGIEAVLIDTGGLRL